MPLQQQTAVQRAAEPHRSTPSPTNSEPHTDDAEYAVFELTVADTGIGMSREFQAHAFEPFAQENTASRASYMGTGLGLAIAHEIIEKMGGDIAFQSEQGKGTVFTVHLRFRINDHAVPTEKSRAELPHHSVIGANILLAEDNELNAEIAEFSLEHAGMTVTVAHDGSEALELFENSAIGEYDLILMDVMMPVLDGLEATRRIRASGRADARDRSDIRNDGKCLFGRCDRLPCGGNERAYYKADKRRRADKQDRMLHGGKADKRYKQSMPDKR